MIKPGSLCKIVCYTDVAKGTQLGSLRSLSSMAEELNPLGSPFLTKGSLVTVTGIMDPNDNGTLRYVVLASVDDQARLGWLYMSEVELIT
jgi:hypothetical protein